MNPLFLYPYIKQVKMITYPNAKINLGLFVTEKRVDGYHNIESLFVPIALYDILEFLPREKKEKTLFTSSGIVIDCDNRDNLVLKAYNLLKHRYKLPPLLIHLHKQIPLGAGLGGGSADAAFMLNGLNQVFKLQIPSEKLAIYAEKIGSDCPFFIQNQPSIATKKKTKLQLLSALLPLCHMVVVHPGIHVSTKEAYDGIAPSKPKHSISEILSFSPSEWKEELVNDFEHSVFIKHPGIKKLKEDMYHAGAFYASMSGSGSSVFGLFSSPPKLNAVLKKHLIWQGDSSFTLKQGVGTRSF